MALRKFASRFNFIFRAEIFYVHVAFSVYD